MSEEQAEEESKEQAEEESKEQAEEESKEYKKYKKFITEFITKERDYLKTEINQIKQGQVTLLTATISAVALIFTFIFSFYRNQDIYNVNTTGVDTKDISIITGYPEIFMILPLLILIPSAIIFFHKSYEANEKTAYIQLTNDVILNSTFFEDYKGYENYKPDFDSGHSTKLSTMKNFEKLKSLVEIIFANIGNRFWSMAFWAYAGLIAINFVLPRHLLNSHHSDNGQITLTYTMIFLALCLIAPYLIGKSHGNPQKYWKNYGKIVNFLIYALPYLILIAFSIIILAIESGIDLSNIINNPFATIVISRITEDLSIISPLICSIFGILILVIGFSGVFFAFYWVISKDSQFSTTKSECSYLIIIFIVSIMLAGFASDYYSNLYELLTFIIILISCATILYCFTETWSLKVGSKSIKILKTSWKLFIEDYTSKIKDTEEISEPYLLDLDIDDEFFERIERIDTDMLYKRFIEISDELLKESGKKGH